MKKKDWDIVKTKCEWKIGLKKELAVIEGKKKKERMRSWWKNEK